MRAALTRWLARCPWPQLLGPLFLYVLYGMVDGFLGFLTRALFPLQFCSVSHDLTCTRQELAHSLILISISSRSVQGVTVNSSLHLYSLVLDLYSLGTKNERLGGTF